MKGFDKIAYNSERGRISSEGEFFRWRSPPEWTIPGTDVQYPSRLCVD